MPLIWPSRAEFNKLKKTPLIDKFPSEYITHKYYLVLKAVDKPKYLFELMKELDMSYHHIKEVAKKYLIWEKRQNLVLLKPTEKSLKLVQEWQEFIKKYYKIKKLQF